MTPSLGDIDFLIMSNAFDESRLAEVLADCCQQFPELGESTAQQLLMKRLSELVSEGKVGIYEVEIGRRYRSSSEYRDLSTGEALAVIQSAMHWGWAPDDEASVMHYLFAKAG